MKYLSFIFGFLVVSWFPSLNIALAEDKEKVIVISEKVGEVIDAEERERFGLWPAIKGFKSAVFLQLSDGSYVAEVTYEKDGEEKKARTPQSEIAIKSLKSYIEKVSERKIQPVSLADEEKTEEEKAESYSQGELVSISGKVGASIDKTERNEYALFMNIQNFERATFYWRKEGGYLIEIQTVTDTLISVVLDTAMVSILSDYVGRYKEVQANRESFERKWSIISYDGQGIPITENEILRYRKKVSCCALGCGLGGGVLGLAVGAIIAFADDIGKMLSDEEKGTTGGEVAAIGGGIILGAGAGYFIGNRIDKGRINKDSIVSKIKESRTPR